jgi:SAM-dependent methyltransferase
VTPEDYEAWYDTPRGRWIGATEYELLAEMLRPAPGSTLLDVGCGTGHFTRLFAGAGGALAVGLDPNEAWLSYARARTVGAERYVAGRAESLPFPDCSFDFSVSVTALCFVDDQEQALRELLRVTRRRFAIGLLNRHSWLYLQKGVGGGTGGYRGANWHTAADLRELFSMLPAADVTLRTAVLVPHGGAWAHAIEAHWPRRIAAGGFLAVAGEACGTGAPRA